MKFYRDRYLCLMFIVSMRYQKNYKENNRVGRPGDGHPTIISIKKLLSKYLTSKQINKNKHLFKQKILKFLKTLK